MFTNITAEMNENKKEPQNCFSASQITSGDF